MFGRKEKKQLKFKTEMAFINLTALGGNSIAKLIHDNYEKGWEYVDNIPGKSRVVLIFRRIEKIK